MFVCPTAPIVVCALTPVLIENYYCNYVLSSKI